jgi:DNA-binding response OmpR family regulator
MKTLKAPKPLTVWEREDQLLFAIYSDPETLRRTFDELVAVHVGTYREKRRKPAGPDEPVERRSGRERSFKGKYETAGGSRRNFSAGFVRELAKTKGSPTPAAPRPAAASRAKVLVIDETLRLDAKDRTGIQQHYWLEVANAAAAGVRRLETLKPSLVVVSLQWSSEDPRSLLERVTSMAREIGAVVALFLDPGHPGDETPAREFGVTAAVPRDVRPDGSLVDTEAFIELIADALGGPDAAKASPTLQVVPDVVARAVVVAGDRVEWEGLTEQLPADCGFSVEFVDPDEEQVETLSVSEPDVVIVDDSASTGLDPFMVYKMIRLQMESTPVVMVAAKGDESVLDRFDLTLERPLTRQKISGLLELLHPGSPDVDRPESAAV